MTRFTILLKRNPSMTHEQFVDYHKTMHAPLFSALPAVRTHVRRYVQQHALPVNPPGLPAVKYDGVTELWFENPDALDALFSDAEYLARIRPDEEKFLDLHGCDFLVPQENPVF